ncbi:cyclic nucleotide-gated ion channel 20 [Spatholobus suberectus]|nr:cyclic nucleotide-gated ion channel 20 [Spatholobus suberectus]
MANFGNDKLPMLSDTDAQPYDEPLDSKFRRIVTRTQSASISIPMSSLESYEKETSLVGHTGPLQSKRKTPFMQMSGPLYATTGTGNLLQRHIAESGNKAEERKTDNFATFHGTGSNYWENDYDRKNEHLLRSGQLGMCNDPYCTSCPTYFNASQQRSPKPLTRWDPKII